MTFTPTSVGLQTFLDSAESPTLILDFRIVQYLEGPFDTTVSKVVLWQNIACASEKFRESVDRLLSQRLWNGGLNPRLQIRDPIIGKHTERHVVSKDLWTCSGVGPYRIWTLQQEGGLENINSQAKNDEIGAKQAVTPINTEQSDGPSLEDQLYNKLDHINGPLKAFCKIADRTLIDIQKAMKDLANPSPSQDVHSCLNPIELNLRTLSSGLSLLKDISDISSLAPPSPPPSPPKEVLSNQALLSRIISRIHPPPVEPSGCSRNPQPWNTSIPPTRLDAHLPTLRALIVEDNLVNSKILCKIAQKIGVLPEYVVTAFNGIEGLERLEDMVMRDQFPDIIFVDAAMPVMGGFEFLTEYNKRYPGRRARIVGMTAYAHEKDIRMEQLGANVVIQKPLRIQPIRKELEKAANLKMTREIEFRGKL